jgi:hypothetical protein
MRLIDERTPDGSRHFACFPQTATWRCVRDHALLLPQARLLNVVGDEGKAWFDFNFRGHCFLIQSRERCFRLIVRDPQCADLILYQVGCHFEHLLGEAQLSQAASDDTVPFEQC